VTFTVRALSVA